MFFLKNFYLYILLLFCFANLHAQKLTGTWQGVMDEREFLQVNVVQIGETLCGYTWDYALNDTRSFCKAYFRGSYNKLFDAWYVEGYSFMQSSGDHSLMQLKFKIVIIEGKIVMKGLCRIKPSLFFGGGDPSSFELEKISSRPTIITQTMKDCMAESEPVKKKKLPQKNSSKKPPFTPPPPLPPVIRENQTAPVIKKDTVIPIKEKPEVNNLPKQTNGRENKELRRIIVNERKITLSIYDNGTIDGDTVSVYYNGKPIVKNRRLTANPITVNVELDEGMALHSIVLFAENLGTIPPNTALVIFTTAAGKRYELYASATLEQNAEIIFEYIDK